MTCRDFVEFLMEYLSDELPAEERRIFEEHLRNCPSCVRYLQSYQETIRLGKSAYCSDPAATPGTGPGAGAEADRETIEKLVRAILAARAKRNP